LNRKLILLNLTLVALIAMLAWQVRARWRDTQAHQRAILTQQVRAKEIFAPPPPPSVKPITPAEYLEVAQKMLFTKDRNPTVVVEAPPPKPKPKMPDLPSFYGLIAIGPDPVILLSDGSAAQQGYHAGEKVGPFAIVSFDSERIRFDWDGEPVERRLSDLAPKEAAASTPAQPVANGDTTGQGPVRAIVPEPKPLGENDPKVGKDLGGGFRGCVPGDNSPPGTVQDGFRKTISQTLMGASCLWEPVK